jgi:type IV fimbrial biogenesis protein FimT
MERAVMKKIPTTRLTEMNRKFFIGSNMPSVCYFSHHNLPFVCHKRPYDFFNNKNRGFTLTELVLVVVVIGVLAAIAIPNMSHFIETNRLITHANDMLADISVARTEAIKQSKQTGICTLVPGSSPPTCNTTADWGTGWVVFIDENNDGVWSSGDKVVRAHESVSTNITITPGTITSPSTTLVPASLMLVTRLGSRPTGGGDFVITICNTKLLKSRVLTTSVTGRPTMTEGTC